VVSTTVVVVSAGIVDVVVVGFATVVVVASAVVVVSPAVVSAALSSLPLHAARPASNAMVTASARRGEA